MTELFFFIFFMGVLPLEKGSLFIPPAPPKDEKINIQTPPATRSSLPSNLPPSPPSHPPLRPMGTAPRPTHRSKTFGELDDKRLCTCNRVGRCGAGETCGRSWLLGHPQSNRARLPFGTLLRLDSTGTESASCEFR